MRRLPKRGALGLGINEQSTVVGSALGGPKGSATIRKPATPFMVGRR